MTSLQIGLIIVVVLIIVAGIITYFVRGNYYKQIDELDQQKKELYNQAPYDELKEMNELSLTGQSAEMRDAFQKKWDLFESTKFPELEQDLFEAEQATDRYRLNESKKIQERIQASIKNISAEIEQLIQSMSDLIEREQANLKMIDTIKKRYHEVRKSLLAYSFSFGPASETFEEKLSVMEEDFTEFSENTVSGDHEEANKIIERLSENIQETEEQMDQIPSMLTKIHEEYERDLNDLQQGYEQMVEQNYQFPEDTIIEDIEELKQSTKDILENIRLLELEKANDQMKQLEATIEELYIKMEAEVEAKPQVQTLLNRIQEGISSLQEESQRLIGIEQRLAQSYVMLHNEDEVLQTLANQIVDAFNEYNILDKEISNNALPFSVAHMKLNYLFNELKQVNTEIREVSNYLENYRKEELRFRNELSAMEEAMYDMKRALENERLPGLPENYLELFFSTTERIENFAQELSQVKISLTELRRIHQVTEEDVIQLSQMTEDIIFRVHLIERISQRLYRFRDSHKGILETIRYSESLFNEDYDYETALRLLTEKLENIAPGTYDKIVEEYEAEQEHDDF